MLQAVHRPSSHLQDHRRHHFSAVRRLLKNVKSNKHADFEKSRQLGDFFKSIFAFYP
jgi:hypothetical protein